MLKIGPEVVREPRRRKRVMLDIIEASPDHGKISDVEQT
jgi:hypothetical protein